MADNIVPTDLTALVDGWMKAEQEGALFPVPFDVAWVIGGYSKKSNGKRGLKGLVEGKHFCSQMSKTSTGGRSSELIHLSCDGMKHLCLMAQTPEGEEIRGYFIEAEKKWKLTQQHFPAIAQEIDLIHEKQELARLEAQASQAELQLIQFKHIVTSTMPPPLQQKILGYKEIATIEYRDRIIHNDDLLNDGTTTNKTELCHRYNILTRNGKPDYKRLNQILDRLPKEAFDLTVRLQDNYEVKREFLPHLDRLVDDSNRNLFLGE